MMLSSEQASENVGLWWEGSRQVREQEGGQHRKGVARWGVAQHGRRGGRRHEKSRMDRWGAVAV